MLAEIELRRGQLFSESSFMKTTVSANGSVDKDTVLRKFKFQISASTIHLMSYCLRKVKII